MTQWYSEHAARGQKTVVTNHSSGTMASAHSGSLDAEWAVRNTESGKIIDDNAGKTLASASTLDKDIKGQGKSGADRDAAAEVGKLIAARAKESGVDTVVFDRGGYLFHGRVKALADAAREAGLNF